MSNNKSTENSDRKISVRDAAAIARLARLDLPPETLERFAAQCNDVLDYMELLERVDTSGVEPLYSPVRHGTVFREDEVRKEYPRELLLANAPEDDGSFFIVPKIV